MTIIRYNHDQQNYWKVWLTSIIKPSISSYLHTGEVLACCVVLFSSNSVFFSKYWLYCHSNGASKEELAPILYQSIVVYVCFHKIFTTKTKLLPVVLQTITVHYVYWLAYRIVYYSCIQQYSYYKYSPKISCFKPRVEEFFRFFIVNDYEGSNLERNIVIMWSKTLAIHYKQDLTNPIKTHIF